jgi:hypothetical protein
MEIIGVDYESGNHEWKIITVRQFTRTATNCKTNELQEFYRNEENNREENQMMWKIIEV